MFNNLAISRKVEFLLFYFFTFSVKRLTLIQKLKTSNPFIINQHSLSQYQNIHFTLSQFSKVYTKPTISQNSTQVKSFNQHKRMSKQNTIVKQSRIPTKIKSAVLICDSFNQNTISNVETYNCLSLVDQFPAIWYTINWLGQNDVEQIFVLYSKDKEEIQSFFSTYEKSIDLKTHLNYVKPGQLKSFGDAVRQVQFRNLVNEDFLILYADTVTNIDLSTMIHSHFLKKDELKSVVLTSSFQTGYSKIIHILNSQTGQILQMQSSLEQDFEINRQKINLKKVNIEFRRDIVACQIFICTVEVLKSFKESYEYTNMNQFIIGMLTSEVYQEKINAYIVGQQERAHRSSKAAQLYKLYMGYIAGYFYPYTVYNQEQLQPRQKQLKKLLSTYSVRQFNQVIKKGTSISPSCRLSNNVYIGQDTIVENECQISRSVILKKCKISAKVILKNCLVLQGCQIKSNGGAYEYCKFQNIGNTMKITCFKDEIIQNFQDNLINKELYETTPNDSEEDAQNFEQQLESLLKDEPNQDSIIDLFTLRKCHNKELHQFTKEMVRVLQPNGVKGVQQFVQKWGQIIFKLHEQQGLVLSSLLHACQHVQKYGKALHIFLQFFYIQQLLTKEAIKQWFGKGQQKIKPQILSLCKPFLEKLDQESEEEDQDDE